MSREQFAVLGLGQRQVDLAIGRYIQSGELTEDRGQLFGEGGAQPSSAQHQAIEGTYSWVMAERSIGDRATWPISMMRCARTSRQMLPRVPGSML